jgi:hypothetical protein
VGDQANLIGEGDARLVVLVAGVILVVSLGLVVLDWLRSRERMSDQLPASQRAKSGRDTTQIAGNQFSGATTIVVGGETFGRIDQAPGTVQPHDQPVLDVSPYDTPDILLANFRDHAAMVHLKVENEPAKSSVDAAGLFVRLTASGPGIPSPITITARPRSSADYPANERRVVIRRGDHEDFDVAIKFAGERDAYMVNSEGFNFGGRRTEWRLPPGTYSLAVLVFHDSGSSEYAFRLVNATDGALSLEPITAEHHVDQDRQQLITEIKAFLLTATNEAAWKAEPLWYPGTAREYVGRAVAILGDELKIDQPADDPSSRLYYYAILRQVLRALTGDRAEEQRPTIREWGEGGVEVLPTPSKAPRPASGAAAAILKREAAKAAAARVAANESADPPADWTGRFWRGKEIIPCAWDDYRTTSEDNRTDHLETHTDPPAHEYEREASLVPRQWAKQPIHFLGDGTFSLPGVPADPDHTIYVTEKYANELVASGLYDLGPVERQEHALVDAGPPPRCKCGHEARNTAWFQSHLHEKGV